MTRIRSIRLLALAAFAACSPSIALAGMASSCPASNDSAAAARPVTVQSAEQAAISQSLVGGGIDRLSSLNQRLGIDNRFGPSAMQPQLATAAPVVPVDSPAAPASRGGASLVMAALVGIGTITGARSSYRPGAAWAPEWVHTGGPQQIGHSTVLDLSGDFDLFVIRPFETPTPTRFWSVDDPPVRLQSQHTPLSAAPRGPPCCA